MQNIVGLEDGFAPDQRQAISRRSCEMYTLSGYEYILFPSGPGCLDYYEFWVI